MIAIIAGTGNLPIQACKSLIADKKKFFVISLFPEDNLSDLESVLPDKSLVVHNPFYKTKMLLDELKARNTEKVLFIGKVDKRNLLKKLKLDWFGIKLLAKLATKSDFDIMNKIAEILSEHGITVISQDTVLHTLLVAPGLICGNLSDELKQNINIGIELAKKISFYDIGQTVVVKDKMILAVEAIEGTDECIKRGLSLGGSGVIVCKAAQQNHNKKFDLPTIGPSTLKNLQSGDVSAIAWLSDKTFVVDKEEFIKRAKELNITLVSIS